MTINPEFEALFQQTPTPESAQVGSQEPAQGIDESAKESMPEDNNEVKDGFTDADDQPIPYTVKVDWTEVWPRAQELLSQGMT